MVSPVEPPSLPAVGGTPALTRVHRGGQRKEGRPRQQEEAEDAEKDSEKGEAPRKGRHIDERA